MMGVLMGVALLATGTVALGVVVMAGLMLHDCRKISGDLLEKWRAGK